MTHGTFAWNELLTNDVEAAKAFYAATVGWSYRPMAISNGTYWIAMVGEKSVAGIMDMAGVTPPGVPPHWFAYLEVDDVNARAASIAAHGGKLLRPLFDIPGIGRIAIVNDATGAAVGWVTSVPPG